MFYLLMLQSILGLQSVGLNTDVDLNYTWQTRALFSVSAIAIYLAGFTEVTFYILPFLIIGILSDLMATLIVAGIVEIDEEEYEDDGKEEKEKQD
jgi:preprotein translocase subunit SecF